MRALVVLVLGLASSCRVPSDLGAPCTLMRPSDAGLVAVTEGEIQRRLATHAFDVLTFGAVECEELVCVREAESPAGASPDSPARGHCSRECRPGVACRTGNEAIDAVPERALGCRALLLDEATLNALSRVDAGIVPIAAAGAREPYFCAAGP